MAKTKVTKIPMATTHYYDKTTGKYAFLPGVLSHIAYDGALRWERARPEDQKYIDNIPWEDELTYETYYRGRSAAGAVFKNAAGQRFTVFMVDLDQWIPQMVNGVIKGKFIYCKRGMNYGVKLYEA